MASNTRSGRILKHEGTSSSRSGNNSSAKDTRNVTSSGSAAGIDSSSLRNSSSETAAKKMTSSSPSSRNSERLVNQALLSSSDKMAGRLENKRSHSPLRRSERIEKNSPGSKKMNKSASPQLKKRKLNDNKDEKIAVTSTENQSKDKLDIKSSGILKRRPRLDARRYRALLQPKKGCSDDDDTRIKDDNASKGNSSNSASSNSKKVNKGLEESNGRKEDMLCSKYSVDNSQEASDGSSSGSREFPELTMGSATLRKSARLSGKKNFKDNSPVSKYSGSSTQSSLVLLTTKDNGGCTSQREINGVDNTHDAHKLGMEELEALGLVASTSEGKSAAVDTSPKCGVSFKGSKNANTDADLDSNVSLTAGNKDTYNPEIYKPDVTSSPGETTSKDINRCIACNKLERVHNVSEAHEVCLCNVQREHNIIPSVIEEPCERVSPCERESPATCSQGNNVKGNLLPEPRKHSPGSEKQNCSVKSPSKVNVSIPINVDRGIRRVSNAMHTSEEHLRVVHLNESLVAVQTDSSINACVVCKHPGQLLCCDGKGCKQSYHLSCLNPPLKDVPLGVWLCHVCVKKKVESGVYAVSEGIESVCDVKEEMQNGKHYFVKYKGLAHVHNRWVPESHIILEAPMLAAKFDKECHKEKATRWKCEWTEPHRLLQKRHLMPKNLSDEYFFKHGNNFSYCYHEWLVKWKGLGYEYATWELENSPFLCSSDAKLLIHDFERRHEEAKKMSDPLRADRVLQVKKSSFRKLTRLPDDCSAILDNDHLNSVNRLREFWHKSQNAVFIDDQERIIKSILFISSLKPHICRPILVISAIHSLSRWEAEFVRLSSSINVVVYTGTKDIRKLIRTLEFYEEGGCVMLQVLLSHPDAIIEDFDTLDCISWEALIIDEGQNPRVTKHFEQFKNLSTEFRLLLLSGQLKDNVAEHLNLLSFLESGGKENSSSSSKYGTNDSAGALAILKEKLKRYLAYERKSGTSKFLEYWVPVWLSNVQLEQYCSTLASNSSILRSCSKIDHVEALRDILISTRKCCDHPYLLGGSLQNSPIKDLPLGKHIEASGKLHLLDKFLHEIKNQGLRVLILFQSIGRARRDSIGDILEDILRQRFGDDSYERVDSRLIMSKKLAALSKFNDKANGRFVFLIENRACLPSIKLSSVDAAVIFDSDWNPLNDLRALQRIHIESQFEHVRVFRLYSSCTVEEKVLILAKQDMILDSNIQNISPSNSHLLLSWGAFHLFNELDEFHRQDNVHDYSENSFEKCFLHDSLLKILNDVLVELVKQLPGKADNDSSQCLLLIKAQQSGVTYSRNISLLGERDGISALDKDPPSFWSNLLERRYPQWRFISEPSQRLQRKVQHFEESSQVPEVENDEVRKKRRKLTTNTVDPISLPIWLEDRTKGMGEDAKILDDFSPCSFSQPASIPPMTMSTFPSYMPMEPETYGTQSNAGTHCMPSSAGIINQITCNSQASSVSDDAAELHKFPNGESEGRQNVQRALHLSLKPELSELCDTLKLPDDVKGLVHRLLEYVLKYHHVDQEPDTILQAIKISLCWRAASFLKHKVDHKECLALSKKYLNYMCTEEQVKSVYSKLQMSMKSFSPTSASRHQNEPKSLESQSSASSKADGAQQMQEGTSESASSCLQKSGEIKEVSDGHRSSRLLVLKQDQAPMGQPPPEIQQNLCSSRDALLKKRVELIDIIHLEREDALLLKQRVELSDFNVHREEEKMRLKSTHDDLLELILSIHTDSTIKNDKIKLLNQDFSKKIAEFDQHMKCQHRKLTVMQEDAKNKERDIRDRWLEEAKVGALAEAFETVPLTETGFTLEEFKEVIEHVEACDDSGSIMSVSRPASDRSCSDITTISTGITENHLDTPSTFSNRKVEDGQTLASHSSNMAEAEPLQPIGTSGEILEIVPPNMVEVVSIEPNGTSAEIPGQASDVMCNDMITMVPGMSTGTTENHLEMSANFPIRSVENVQILVSHSSDAAEVEPIQPNGTSAEIPETVLSHMVEEESIQPNDTSAEIPATILPLEDDDISKDSETPFSDSEVINILDNQPDAMHMVPLQTNGRTVEIPVTVSPDMAVSEYIEPNETSTEIPAMVLSAGNGNITKDGGTPFSESDVLNVLDNQIETNEASNEIPAAIQPAGGGNVTKYGGTPFSESDVLNVLYNQIETNETSTEIPATILPAGDDYKTKDRATLFSKSDVMNVLGNHPDTMHMVPSVVTTSLPKETEIPAFQTHNRVEVASVEPNRISTGVPATIWSPEEGYISMETVAPPSQMNTTGRGPDEIDSTVATTEAIVDRDIPEGEDNSDGAYMRSSALQTHADSSSISHVSPNSCCETSVSSNLVLSVSEHERLAVAVGTECEEGFSYPQTTTAVSSGDVLTSEVNPTVQHTNTSDLVLHQVPPVDDFCAENGQASTPQSSGTGGELHTESTHSSQPTALLIQQPNITAEMQAEESNQLAPRTVLHPVPPAETLGIEGEVHPEGICCSTSQTEAPAQQLIVTAAMQTNQSNQLISESVVHPSLLLDNLLPETMRSEGIGSTGVPQDPGSRLFQILPMAAWMNPQGLHPDPLQNELMRIQKQVEIRSKMHEDKKLQVKLECEQEIEKIRKKYDAVLQDDEAEFHQDKKILTTLYGKVLVNQILAEEFRTKFIDPKAGASTSPQGRSSSSMQQFLQASQTLHAPRPSSTSGAVHVPTSANLPPVGTPARASTTLPLTRSGAQVPASFPVTSGLVVGHAPSAIPASHVRSQFNHMLSPRPNLQGGTNPRAPAPRAPAPHLHRFRPQTSMMPPILSAPPSHISSQQHPRSNLGTALVAATTPPIHLPRAPLSRTNPPVSSGQSPLPRGVSLPSVELPRDLGAANVEVRPSVHGWAPFRLPVNNSETATTSTVVATRPAASAAPVVCLSDDE